MRCDEARDLIGAWVDDELPGPGAHAVANHVATCAACRALTSDLKLLSAELRVLGREAPPEGLAARVRAGLADAADTVPSTGETGFDRWRGVARFAASMAAVCVLSVFGTWSAMRAPVSFRPQSE